MLRYSLRVSLPFGSCLVVPDFPGTRLLRWPSIHSEGHTLRLRRSFARSARVQDRYTPAFHPAAPFGLALGPDLPRADEPSPGILGLSVCRILTCISLLTPAFSLPCSPYAARGHTSANMQRSLPLSFLNPQLRYQA